ncbi:ribosome silencing factor [Weizmannia acidilactici]|uniref:ribosome silencing factor n=1 Tax=Weizmannia acidilactici TaxID=2607726 RepID=UPI00124DB090|nr:ribosome silencing factor [Weizmannia acidilactici]
MDNQALLKTVVKACDDKRAEDIVVLDMRGISLIADYFLICNGNSDKQIQAIAREVKEKVEEAGHMVKRIEGFEEGKWVLIDLGDIVAHIFNRDERNYYNLERLWGDAPSVSIESVLS